MKTLPDSEKPEKLVSWVYILQVAGGKYYTGWTNRLEKRMAAHWQKKTADGKSPGAGAKFTRSFRPQRIMAVWQLTGGRSEGLRVESFLKKKSRSEKEGFIAHPEKLTQIYRGDIEILPYSTEGLPWNSKK